MTKYLFDRILALVGLIILLPVFIIISILIKIKMPGPIFFRQTRVGMHSRLFKILKFRTMVVNNDKNTVSVKNDIRITPLGAKLRRYKIDELPALWNVLVGDMSFVGPRPDVPGFADKLKGTDRIILKLRPGITGSASLKYHNEEEILANIDNPIRYNNEVIWPDKVKINIEYFQTQSFLGDLKIIFRTLIHRK